MYAIVNNNKVILTQTKWNTRMFTSILLDDCNIDRKILLSEETSVPLTIDENTKILKVADNKPDYNPRTQWLDGPSYTIENDQVSASYTVKDLDLDIAKYNLKSFLPAIRYEKENRMIQVTVENQPVTISTDRDNRAILAAKLLSIGTQESFSWKFPEGWITVSQSDLENIIYQINVIVQEAFDWEFTKTNSIDLCATLSELDAIDIYDTNQQP